MHPDIPVDEEMDEYLSSLSEWVNIASDCRDNYPNSRDRHGKINTEASNESNVQMSLARFESKFGQEDASGTIWTSPSSICWRLFLPLTPHFPAAPPNTTNANDIYADVRVAPRMGGALQAQRPSSFHHMHTTRWNDSRRTSASASAATMTALAKCVSRVLGKKLNLKDLELVDYEPYKGLT
ncbi:hypothetical protein BJY52DRAFT_1416444 [Lactarius psammicola]|nr:hypothetical protein BJY52DRAFT_1416444 [Lactarius psammicola]